jgi:hypothetical protein
MTTVGALLSALIVVVLLAGVTGWFCWHALRGMLELQREARDLASEAIWRLEHAGEDDRLQW